MNFITTMIHVVIVIVPIFLIIHFLARKAGIQNTTLKTTEIINILAPKNIEFIDTYSPNSTSSYCYFVGYYKERKVKCKHAYKIFEDKIILSSQPKLSKTITLPKIPWYEIRQHKSIYKNYKFNGEEVFIGIDHEKPSREEVIKLLDGLVEACEFVERPDFELK